MNDSPLAPPPPPRPTPPPPPVPPGYGPPPPRPTPPPSPGPPGYAPGYGPPLTQPPSAPTGPGNWVGAIAAAIAMQIVAGFMLLGAFVIAIIAVFAGFGDSSNSAPVFVLLAIPLALAGLGLFIYSGRVAARIAKDGRGWLMLIGGPAILLTLRVGTALLAG